MKKISLGSLFLAIFVLFLLIAGFYFGYCLYKNQFDLYEKQRFLALDMQAQRESYKSAPQVEVVEKVLGQEPWAHIQTASKDTVVRIIAQSAHQNLLKPYRAPEQGGGVGSGFFINGEGEIITNYHVVEEAVSLWIKIPSLGKAIIDVEVVGTCPERDLALLKVTAEGMAFIKEQLGTIPFLPLGNSDHIHRADQVMALGYPLGQASLKSTTGIISGSEHDRGRRVIQISAPINPGSSGGPLVALSGKVVGISFASIIESQNVGYAIPINELHIILDGLRAGGLVRKPFSGAIFINGSNDLADYLHNPKPSGYYVKDIYEGSPLFHSGVLPGDMLYEINGYSVDMYGDICVPWSEDKISFSGYLSHLEVGKEVHLLLYRNGIKKDITFKLTVSAFLPIHPLFIGYDVLEYEIFGGMVIQPLSSNHLPILVNSAPTLTKYLQFEHQKEPVLVLTDIIPNSEAQRLEILSNGLILKEINGKVVATLSDFRAILKEAVESPFITFKTEDGIFFVLSTEKVMKNELKLANIYRYELTQFIKELLEMYEKKKITVQDQV